MVLNPRVHAFEGRTVCQCISKGGRKNNADYSGTCITVSWRGDGAFLLSIWPSLIKSVLMRVEKDIEKIARTFHSGANALLYDASASTEHGGTTGRTLIHSFLDILIALRY